MYHNTTSTFFEICKQKESYDCLHEKALAEIVAVLKRILVQIN